LLCCKKRFATICVMWVCWADDGAPKIGEKEIEGRVPCHRQWHWYFVRRVNYMAHSTCRIPRTLAPLFCMQIFPKMRMKSPRRHHHHYSKDSTMWRRKSQRVSSRETTLNFNQFQMTSCHTCVDYTGECVKSVGGSYRNWDCIVSANRIIIRSAEPSRRSSRVLIDVGRL